MGEGLGFLVSWGELTVCFKSEFDPRDTHHVPESSSIYPFLGNAGKKDSKDAQRWMPRASNSKGYK